MAFGLTIIVRKSSQEIEQHLTNRTDAIMIDKDLIINSIDEAIHFCIKNKNLVRKFGLNAKKKINSYDNNKILKKWIDIINQ